MNHKLWSLWWRISIEAKVWNLGHAKKEWPGNDLQIWSSNDLNPISKLEWPYSRAGLIEHVKDSSGHDYSSYVWPLVALVLAVGVKALESRRPNCYLLRIDRESLKVQHTATTVKKWRTIRIWNETKRNNSINKWSTVYWLLCSSLLKMAVSRIGTVQWTVSNGSVNHWWSILVKATLLIEWLNLSQLARWESSQMHLGLASKRKPQIRAFKTLKLRAKWIKCPT